MRKVLIALFAMIILGIGVMGYNAMDSEPNEVIEEKDFSTEIRL